MGKLIYLDAEDDVASVRMRLEAVRDESAALVIPTQNRGLRSPISMRLVARLADELALDLSVVSGDSLFRRLAQQEGLPAFLSTASYQRYEEARRSRRFSLGAFYLAFRRLVGTFFGVGVVVLFAASMLALGYVLLPQATVTVTPATVPVNDDVRFTADAGASEADYNAMVIPARSISLTVEATNQAPATGQQSTVGGRAGGQVTFTNRTSQVVSIPGGTIVSTAEGVRFATNGQTVLPAVEGSTGRVSITALDAGERGNVARLQINRVDGQLASQVSVLNEEPTKGGGVTSITVVSAEDQKRLADQTMAQIERDARDQLRAQLRQGESMLDPSINIVILSEEFDQQVGAQASVVSLHVRARATALVYEEQDVVDLLVRGWHPGLPAGFFVDNRTLKVGEVQPVEAKGTIAVLEVPVTAVAVSRVDEDKVMEAVRWESPSVAARELGKAFQLAQPPEIKLDPSWATRALRVSVDIRGPSQP